MRVLPILFNTEMVRAILDGRKGCTRRIVKGYIPKDAQFGYTAFTPDGAISCRGLFETTGRPGYGEKFFKLPYQPGDILYVRETWMDYAGLTMYKADCDIYRLDSLNFAGFGWKPSIHMPKEATRIWLKVTDVRVERLQEITSQGAWKEGTRCSCLHPVPDCAGNKTAFIEIWNSTIKKSDLDRYGWDANPYVFVIEFERCEKPEVN